MKKIINLLALFLFLTASVQAQYYSIPYLSASGSNPGGLNSDGEYPVGGGLPTGWTTIFTGPSTSPVYTAATSIPFAFNFNGAAVTQFMCSSTGIVTFDVATAIPAPTEVNGAIPSALVPDNSVCVWGMDAIAVPAPFSSDIARIVTKTFGSAPHRQFWIQFNTFSEPNIQLGWTYWSVVLEEGTDHIYIVDQRTQCVTAASQACTNSETLTLGIQINSTTAVQVGSSPNYNSLSQNNDGTPADNTWFEFIPGTQPTLDISGVSSTMPNYEVMTSAPFSVSWNVRNVGSATVTSAELNYSINGGTPVGSSLYSGLNVAPLGYTSFTHPTTWNPATPGTYIVKSWLSNLNGTGDLNLANDTVTKSVIVVATATQRTPCFEVFTSSTCGPCASAAPNLETLLGNNANKFSCIKYQMNWPAGTGFANGDPYYNTDGNTRKTYYNVSGIPDMYVDGVTQNEGSYNQTQFNNEYAKPAFMTVTGTYTVVGQKVTANIAVHPIADNPSTNLICHIGVVELKTTGNVATNGQTEFHYVEQKMMANGGGNAISALTSGTDVNLSKFYLFGTGNHVEEFTDLLVMAFVQDNITKEVFQSAFLTLATGVSDAETPGNGIIILYPNPVSDLASLMYLTTEVRTNSVKVTNALGALIYQKELGSEEGGKHQLDFSTQEWPAGLYYLTLTLGDKTHAVTMSVVH